MNEDTADQLEPETDDIPQDEPAEDGGRDFDAEASAMGWKPEAEFTGPEGAWRSSEEFVKRGEERGDLAVANNRRLTARVTELEAGLKQQKDVHNLQQQSLRDSLAKDYEDKILQAAEDGDKEAVGRHMRDRDKAMESPAPEPDNAPNPDYTDFVDRNDWYNSDSRMTNYANVTSDELARTNPNLSPVENMRRTEEEVKATFPSYFDEDEAPTPKPRTPRAPVAGARRGGKRKPTGKTYEAMPAEYREGCDESVASKWSDRATFVKNYWANVAKEEART